MKEAEGDCNDVFSITSSMRSRISYWWCVWLIIPLGYCWHCCY